MKYFRIRTVNKWPSINFILICKYTQQSRVGLQVGVFWLHSGGLLPFMKWDLGSSVRYTVFSFSLSWKSHGAQKMSQLSSNHMLWSQCNNSAVCDFTWEEGPRRWFRGNMRLIPGDTLIILYLRSLAERQKEKNRE